MSATTNSKHAAWFMLPEAEGDEAITRLELAIVLADPHAFVRHAVNPAMVSTICAQVEFYLSDANLPNDKFLLKNMQQSGFVPIHVIAQFPRMQAMQVDEATIASALSHSSELVLHQSGTLVRRRTPLAAPAPAVADDWWRCCVVVEELPMDITNEGVRDMLAPFGQVQLVSLHAQQDSAVAGSASRQVMHGAAPLPRKALPRGRALLQPFATVTMGSVEQAGAAVSALEAQALAAGWRSQAPRCRLVVPQRQALAAKPVAKATVGAGGATSAAGERRPGGGHGDTTVPRPKAAQQQHEPLPRTRLAPPPMDGGRAGGGLVLMAKGPDGTRGFARPRSTPAA